MKLKDIGEFGFIERIKNGCLIRDRNVIKGIGDDCCVFKTSGDLATLLTTDMLVENVHFLLSSITPRELGRKSLAVNISDIAAMGGYPKEAVISIAIPDTLEVAFLDLLYDGIKSMAKQFDVNLMGGDTTWSPEHLVINITLVGEATQDEILYRSGAREGDMIFLTGPVGSSAAGLDIMLKGKSFNGQNDLLKAHFDPFPHVKEGRIIAKMRMANSLIDVSDGVAADLGHICVQSGLGAVIEEQNLPTTQDFQAYCEQFNQDSINLSLHVGEDYVLLGTVPPEASGKLENALKSEGCQFHTIGNTVSGHSLKLQCSDGEIKTIRAHGWDHFK